MGALYVCVTEFKDFSKQKRVPTILGADFEATLEASLEQRTKGPKGTINHHAPNSFKLYVISDADLGDIPLQYSFRSTISDVEFVKLISSLSKVITERHNELKVRYALPELTEDEEILFSNATHCIFCKKTLGMIEYAIAIKTITPENSMVQHIKNVTC